MRPAKKMFNNIQRHDMAMLLVLGICPALAVTTSVMNAIAMGLATTFVVSFSNLSISLTRKNISYGTKLFIFFIVTATFTSIADLLLQAFFPDLSKAMGIYIPLLAVNGLVLQRAEHFALKNNFIASFLDGIYSGLLFTVAIMIAGALREMLGKGSIFDIRIVSESARTVLFIILPPGAFIVLGFLVAALQKSFSKSTNK